MVANPSRKPSRRRSSGRVTPKGGEQSSRREQPGRRAAGRRPPPVRGVDEPAQVGRRPSNPAFLLLLGVVWVVCAVVAATGLHTSWRLIPTIGFAGIGLYFLRGGAVTLIRRGDPKAGD
jgi:hypothetical protein